MGLDEFRGNQFVKIIFPSRAQLKISLKDNKQGNGS